MFELRELHYRDTDPVFQDWARLVRAACRMLVLNPDVADAVTVAATFVDTETGGNAADVAAELVAEYALIVDGTVGAHVSMRISRSCRGKEASTCERRRSWGTSVIPRWCRFTHFTSSRLRTVPAVERPDRDVSRA